MCHCDCDCQLLPGDETSAGKARGHADKNTLESRMDIWSKSHNDFSLIIVPWDNGKRSIVEKVKLWMAGKLETWNK